MVDKAERGARMWVVFKVTLRWVSLVLSVITLLFGGAVMGARQLRIAPILVYSGSERINAPTDLYLHDLLFQRIYNLTQTDDVWEDIPVWSPDGEWLAYETDQMGRSACYMRLLSRQQRCATASPLFDTHTLWLPNSAGFLFRIASLDGDTLHQVDVSTGRISTLFSHKFGIFSPDLSPDGQTLLFFGLVNGRNQLFTASLDGTDLRAVTDATRGESFFGRWSPAGDAIVFNSRRDVRMDVAVMDADGQNFRYVTDDFWTDNVFAWLDDGESILFWSDRFGNGGSDLYSITTEGTQLRRLTYTPNSENEVNLSADGSQLAFSMSSNSLSAVYVMPLDRVNSAQPVSPEIGVYQRPQWRP